MSGLQPQNATQGGVQQPLFAPSQNQLGDDIDLNEIFADYFINEFEDPLNAYTSSMANYSGAAAAVALAQKQQQVESSQGSGAPLPTGGIKTAFHTQQPQTPEPAAKKAKQEESVLPVGTGITGRLGLSMVKGQLQRAPAPTPPASVPRHPAAPTAAAPPPAPSASGPLQLPVGVGIRLGGVGGVAPETAQTAMTAQAGPVTMWGGAVGVDGAGASEQAVAERRQRNREHAKRSRVRKKFMLESLQEQVRQLQKENEELRMLVQKKIPAHAQQIIDDCCSKNPLFADDENGATGSAKGVPLVKADFSLMESLSSGQQNFVLSDPRLPDNPIVYASPGFYKLTGYTPDQVLGRNCRFLQGPATDQKAVDVIRTAIANGTDATTCLLNYKADGTPFWNQFFVAALRDSDNCIVNYVGVQCLVEPEAGASALEDKVNAVMPLQSKDEQGGDNGNK